MLILNNLTHATDIAKKIQEASVTIKSSTSSGSGILFTRKDKDNTRTFVWTAGHCIDDLRSTRDVIIKGDTKTVVEFGDASIISEFYEDGRRIGEIKLDARVIRYSDADNGEDLALLEIRKKNFVPLDNSIEFASETPPVGTDLYHVGSLLGQFGANSLTVGVVSQTGRVLSLGAHGKTFTQVTCTAFPGSSGGGVFLKENGKCIGILVRGARGSEQFNFVVPVERIKAWAKRTKVEWAMNKEIEIPENIFEVPIEFNDEP